VAAGLVAATAAKFRPAGGLGVLRGDPAALVGEQHRDHHADVVGLADPAERAFRGQGGDHLGVALEGAVADPGAGGSGRDGVDRLPRRARGDGLARTL
jgi:hypothetical protein